jgi:hypothetical protein
MLPLTMMLPLLPWLLLLLLPGQAPSCHHAWQPEAGATPAECAASSGC